MIIPLLSARARLAVIQAGWPVQIRLAIHEREIEADKPAVSRIVTEQAETTIKDLHFTRRNGGREHDVKVEHVALEGRKVPLAFSLSSAGWEEGAHWLTISAALDKHSHQQVDIPVLVLGKDAFWAKFTRDWESKLNHPPLSGSIRDVWDSVADVQASWHAGALEFLDAHVDWITGPTLRNPKTNVLQTPVNMWTLYQLLRLIQRQSYEQLFWGGRAIVSVGEDDQLLVVRADLKTACETGTHFIRMLEKSAPHLPDLKTIAIKLNPPFGISLIAKFPLHHAAGGGIGGGPEVKVTGPGGSVVKPKLGEFDLRSLKQCA